MLQQGRRESTRKVVHYWELINPYAGFILSKLNQILRGLHVLSIITLRLQGLIQLRPRRLHLLSELRQ